MGTGGGRIGRWVRRSSRYPNNRRAYAGALRRLDAWLDDREFDDTALAAYLAELHDAGRASLSASTAVAAGCFTCSARLPSPAARDPPPSLSVS